MQATAVLFQSQFLLPALLLASAVACFWLGELQPGSDMSQRYVCMLLAGAALLRWLMLRPPAQAAERMERYAMLVLVGAQGARRPLPSAAMLLLFLLSLPLERMARRALASLAR